MRRCCKHSVDVHDDELGCLVVGCGCQEGSDA